MYQTHYILCSAILFCSPALVISYQVYPSEYSYLDSSVTRFERSSANCRRYPSMALGGSARSEDYTHCDGTQFRLADSILGSETYNSNDYYVWPAMASASQLLFIFPTIVNLTTITLHYYSDNLRGLPKLRFYAVPDNFEIWDAPVTTYTHKDIIIQQDGEPQGHKTVSSTNLNFTTRKVLIHKYNRDVLSFALSEAEFFTCNRYIPAATTSFQHRYETVTSSNNTGEHLQTHTDNTIIGKTSDLGAAQTDLTTPLQDVSPHSDKNLTIFLALGVLLTLLILIVGTLVLACLLLIWNKQRKKKKLIECNPEQDGLYSTLARGNNTKEFTSIEVHDQIQLSPSTGQSEPVCGQILNEDVKKIAHSELDRTEPDKSDLEFATYAVVDKKKKNMSVQRKDGSHQSHKNINTVEHEKVNNLKHQQSKEKGNLEEMYAVVQKKAKKFDQQESDVPPVPSHTIESLYSVVQKKT